MTTKRTTKKGAVKAAPLRTWESRYPEYPDLTADPIYADMNAVWAGIERGEQWAIDAMDPALMTRLCAQVAAGESVPANELRWISAAFMKVLLGAAWEEALRLPGREMAQDWEFLHPLDLRDYAIYLDVESRSGCGVTESIAAVADDHAVSFETARAAYYAWKARGGWDGVSKAMSEK